MKITRFKQVESYEPNKDWKRVILCNEKNLSIEHFVKPTGQLSPRHHHPSAQVLVVLNGKLTIITDTEEQSLNENDAVYNPGD